MSLARTAQGPLGVCLDGAEPSSAGGIALSESSSGSGWSTGTTTTAAVEQQGPWSAPLWPSQHALPAQADHSLLGDPTQAGQQAAGRHQQQAGAPAVSMPWQPAAPQCFADLKTELSIHPMPTTPSGWQHGSSGSFEPAAALQQQHSSQQQQQQQQQRQSACPAQPAAPFAPPPQQAAAPTAADLWHSGLDLVVSDSCLPPLSGDEGLPFQLTDAGLEALLSPFEDWLCAAPPAAPVPQQQQQQQHMVADDAAASTRAAAPLPAAVVSSSRQRQPWRGAATQPQVPAAQASGTSPTTSSSPLSSSGLASASGGGGTATSPATDAAGGAGGKAPRRRGGRPRVHHPTAPRRQPAATAAAATAGGNAAAAQPGAPSAVAASPAEPASGLQQLSDEQQAQQQEPQSYKTGGRGPKPKYIFSTKEEAVDARRERNRKAALESYYRKKEHTQRLQAEIAALQAENGALEQLLQEMNATGLCPLPEASNDGINMWLRHCGPSEQPPV